VLCTSRADSSQVRAERARVLRVQGSLESSGLEPGGCCYEFWIEEESAGKMKKDEEVKKAVYVY